MAHERVQQKSKRDEPKSKIRNGTRKVIVVILSICLTTIIFLFHHFFTLTNEETISTLTFLSLPFGYLLFKLILSFFYRPVDIEVIQSELISPFTVSAVMPCYNEGATSVVTAIKSLLRQTYPLKEIIFVDDGSVNREAYEAVCELATFHKKEGHETQLIFHAFSKHQAKRHAQVWGFKKATSDLILVIDSDGIIATNGVEELVKPFAKDDQVGAVVGHVAVRNLGANFLTRMQEISYSGAFSLGRASQSTLNSVVVCSGAISLHRRSIIMSHLDEFLDERVLNVKLKSGDDRRLTFIASWYGWKTKYQATAVCYTNVPEDMNIFIKQRVRWMRSAYLCSIQNLIKKPWRHFTYVIFSFFETYLWLTTLVIWLIFFRHVHLTWGWLIHALVYYLLISYLDTIYYIFHRPFRYMISPFYSVVYGFVLLWTRFKTLFLIFHDSWRTRQQ